MELIRRSGIVIYDTECGDYWAARLERSGLDTLGIHPAGGGTAHLSLAACAEFVKTDRYLAFRERIRRAGISIEFEMHALSWMLPRELFDSHPDWFREQDGVRTPEFNCCASNPAVIEHLSERAAALASLFPSDTGLTPSGSTTSPRRNAGAGIAGRFQPPTRHLPSPTQLRKASGGLTRKGRSPTLPIAERLNRRPPFRLRRTSFLNSRQ